MEGAAVPLSRTFSTAFVCPHAHINDKNGGSTELFHAGGIRRNTKGDIEGHRGFELKCTIQSCILYFSLVVPWEYMEKLHNKLVVARVSLVTTWG